jgi:peptide-methionine (S)-S-oxide reductase
MEKLTLGGGCFWCLDGGYRQLIGVSDVISGYAGGSVEKPSYEQVCSGNTGHAEVVQVHYDPSVISVNQLLDAFFVMHDPTQLNRQGADVGTQYRSVMFYEDEAQRDLFSAALQRAALVWGSGIVTELEPMPRFWPAENYHQNYFEKNPNQGYCAAVVAPKVLKVRAQFKDLLK